MPTARWLIHPLVLAAVATALNAVKPVAVDDAAYMAFARQIAAHPLDPFGFDLHWYRHPEPAMRILASDRVRDAVLASRDQSSAVDMMLRAGAATPTEIAGDVKLAWEGQISPILMWERHPIVTAMGLIPILVLLLLLRRVFLPRRKTPPPQAA